MIEEENKNVRDYPISINWGAKKMKAKKLIPPMRKVKIDSNSWELNICEQADLMVRILNSRQCLQHLGYTKGIPKV